MAEKPHYIIGTAGHIDHGKTALIKALTGINTDRLKEEQERGITIELGFAYFDNVDGCRYGIVDVPGHEKFIPNMLSGAHGFDVVMMVVAADDGVKPQTIEHFEILHLLRIPRAMFVITKIDMVEEGRIEEVMEEIEILTHGSYLADSKIIPASSKTGEGLDDVRAEISRLMSEDIPRLNRPYLRLPIDRAFTITGFGTVITGTIISGNASIDDEVILSPLDRKLRIRNMEVHSEDVKSAVEGQRVAINLPKIEKESIERGMELVNVPLSTQMYSRYYADLELLSHKACRFKNFKRVRVFKGASEAIATLVNLSENQFEPKGKYIVDVGFRKEILIISGERFIIRDETNQYTLGGGEFILPSTIKRAKMTDENHQTLKAFADGDLSKKIKAAIAFEKAIALPIEELSIRFNRTVDEIKSAIENLKDEIIHLKWKGGSFGLKRVIEEKKKLIKDMVSEYHKQNPELPGFPKQELRDKLKRGFFADEEIAVIWDLLMSDEMLADGGEFVRLKDFKIEFKGEDAELKMKILKLYSDFTSNPPKLDRIPELINIDKDTALKIMHGLIKSKEIVLLKKDVYVARKAFDDVVQKTVDYISENGSITIVQFKEMIGAGRNLAVILLEAMDQRGVTIRQENIRVLKIKRV